jgi:AcrR family transcriptional regulator
VPKPKVPPADASGTASVPPRRNGEITRERLLDAAEKLFSEHGIDGVSMRDIAAESGLTLALANYHFGSKEGLYRAVFERRVPRISSERRAALAAVGKGADPHAAIAAVLDALARPWVESRGRPGGLAYTRLVAREAGDPAEGGRGIVATHLDPIAREFMRAMSDVLPGVPRRRVEWAYHFFIGALLLILANPDRVKRLSGASCRVDSDAAVVREIVDFFAGALAGDARAAPAPRRADTRRTTRRTQA